MKTPEQTAAEAYTKTMNRQAIVDVGRILLAGLGVGAVGRGAVGLINGLRPDNITEPLIDDTEDDFVAKLPGLKREHKTAGADDPPSNTVVTRSPSRPDWFQYAALASGIGGAYGGWHLLNSLLKKRRAAELQSDLDAEQSKLDKELLTERRVAKESADNELFDSVVDKLADVMLKRAEPDAAQNNGETRNYNRPSLYEELAQPSWQTSTLKALGTALGPVAALLFGAGAYGGWRLAGKSEDTKKIEEYREAQRRRRVSRPESIMLTDE